MLLSFTRYFKLTKILGISAYYHDSAAALLKNGHVVAAVEEERFSRTKFDDGFPRLAIDWCLSEAGITPKEITSIAFYDKPILKFERLLDNYLGVAPRGLFSFLDVIPKWLHKRIWIKNEIQKHLKEFNGEIIFPERSLSIALEETRFFPILTIIPSLIKISAFSRVPLSDAV